jgi:hypothetical protein
LNNHKEGIELGDLASAYSKHVKGELVERERFSRLSEFFNRVFGSISGLTIISAILAITFGYLGYLSRDSPNHVGLYDIAKIFAGAVVGSTGAAAISNRKQGS